MQTHTEQCSSSHGHVGGQFAQEGCSTPQVESRTPSPIGVTSPLVLPPSDRRRRWVMAQSTLSSDLQTKRVGTKVCHTTTFDCTTKKISMTSKDRSTHRLCKHVGRSLTFPSIGLHDTAWVLACMILHGEQCVLRIADLDESQSRSHSTSFLRGQCPPCVRTM